MLTYKQIVRAVTNQLIDKFPDIEIQASDVEEGFQRPSFYVILDDIERDTRKNYSIVSMTIRIYFFPSNRYEYALEVLDMQFQLEQLFNLIMSLEDRVITINRTSSMVVDKVLEFGIELEYHDSAFAQQEPNTEVMQELKLNV
ncbi:hypothetical protein M6D81_11880 [Paenibacillus sp. J5C_2022]|uniref:phage tail terminator family protein n=1 Tax=Paenibacillus sp. J5C2022 TaxID=2977129 RepID=UPI0021D19546|nr:hypothetical protein [Paenibacillus sp. J5C2022]MCU6709404.1 hypothetical protein [Paenibacillus sp. J5C2022]